MHVGVVESWADGVLPTTSVHVHIDFLGRDRSWLWSQLVYLLFVPVGEVFTAGCVQVGGVAHELEARHVAARVGIVQVRGWLVNARAWCSRAETRNLS